MSFTIEQKLAALRRAIDDAREYERKTRPGYLCLPEQIDKLLAIIADYEHLPALVEAACSVAMADDDDPVWSRLDIALAHFTEAGGQG